MVFKHLFKDKRWQMSSSHLQKKQHQKSKKKNKAFSINIDNEGIKASDDKKLLGVNLNNKLGFGFWYSCYKYLSNKLHNLARTSLFMSIQKVKTRMFK